MFSISSPTSLEEINYSIWKNKKVQVYVKRDDQIDAEISGNKWRKLKYNLLQAKKNDVNTILTFGGAYSNHIVATAAACNKYGFNSIGIIRGDELSPDANPTLQKASNDGMKLQFISRTEYKNRDSSIWLKQLADEYDAMIISEGGSNQLALKGVTEIVPEINVDFNYIVCPVGTGGTLAGISQSLNSSQRIIGISALKGEDYLEGLVSNLLGHNSPKNWELNHNYYLGGYAKYDDSLISFINQFHNETNIPLDPIYTGKMMMGVSDLIEKNFFPYQSIIVCLHTGGLQGISGFNQQFNENLRTSSK